MHSKEEWATLTPEQKAEWAKGVISKGAPKEPGVGQNLLAAALTGGTLGGFAGGALKGGKGAAIGTLVGTLSQLPLWAAVNRERHEREAKTYAGESAKAWNTVRKYNSNDPIMNSPDSPFVKVRTGGVTKDGLYWDGITWKRKDEVAKALNKAAEAMVNRRQRKGKRKESVTIAGQSVDVAKLNQAVAGRKPTNVPLESIDDSNLKRSKSTGFKKKRYDKVPLDKPILMVGDQVLDGRHRYFKAKDAGRSSLPAIKVTMSDLKKTGSGMRDLLRLMHVYLIAGGAATGAQQAADTAQPGRKLEAAAFGAPAGVAGAYAGGAAGLGGTTAIAAAADRLRKTWPSAAKRLQPIGIPAALALPVIGVGAGALLGGHLVGKGVNRIHAND